MNTKNTILVILIIIIQISHFDCFLNSIFLNKMNNLNKQTSYYKEYLKNRCFYDNIDINSWAYYQKEKVPNWNISGDSFEIGFGKEYNKKWEEGIVVAELDVLRNESISQEFEVPNEFNCIFSFTYSAKTNFTFLTLKTSGLLVKVNNNEVLRLNEMPDDSIRVFSKEIKSKKGKNKIEVIDIGKSDAHGTLVSCFSFTCPE